MPSSIQIQGRVGQKTPMCICQDAGTKGKWVGHSICDCRYMNLEPFWGFSMSSGNMWSMVNSTPYKLNTDNNPRTFQVYPDTIIPTSEDKYALLKDKYWVCGSNAYHWLPERWSGCCYIASLKTHLTFLSRTGDALVIQKSQKKRVKRADYRPHLRISSGVKTL